MAKLLKALPWVTDFIKKQKVMKILKNHFKSISYLLAFFVLLQGCTVYKTYDVTLWEAARTQDKVKLVTNQGETEEYLYVVIVNEQFYGVKEVNGKLTRMLLEEQNLQSIRTKEKGTPAIIAIFFVYPLIAALMILGLISELDNCVNN